MDDVQGVVHLIRTLIFLFMCTFSSFNPPRHLCVNMSIEWYSSQFLENIHLNSLETLVTVIIQESVCLDMYLGSALFEPYNSLEKNLEKKPQNKTTLEQDLLTLCCSFQCRVDLNLRIYSRIC